MYSEAKIFLPENTSSIELNASVHAAGVLLDSLRGLKLLVYESLSNWFMRP
jgi:hypothetical protein